jgi:hypothetical protein
MGRPTGGRRGDRISRVTLIGVFAAGEANLETGRTEQ